MVDTPTGESVDSLGVVDFLVGIAPFVFLGGGCPSAVAHRCQYRDPPSDRRRANGYAYAAFVVWTTIEFGRYALWT